MPKAVRCPACGVGTGVARAVTTVRERPAVVITLVCQACGHEWHEERESPPMRPAIDPSETKLAS